MTETRIHRTGTPAEGHEMTLDDFRKFLGEVIDKHQPCSDVPEARISFPAGFWVTYASPDDVTIIP